MTGWSIAEVLRVTGAGLLCSPETEIKSIVRQGYPVSTGGLYVITNEIDNEMKLVSNLKAGGAWGIITDNCEALHISFWKDNQLGVIKTDNITAAYLSLSGYSREKINFPLIEITGSSGNRTAAEMIYHVLEEEMKTFRNNDDINSYYSAADKLINSDSSFQAGIIGCDLEKDILRKLTEVVKPELFIVTDMERSRMSMFHTMKEIRSEMENALREISPSGTLLINGDDLNCLGLNPEVFKGAVYTFGLSPDNDIYATDIINAGYNTLFSAHFDKAEIACIINTVGENNVLNALCAIFAGIYTGISPEKITNGLKKYRPLPGCLDIFTGKNNCLIVDDTYSANPDAAARLLKECSLFPKPLILILGDMEPGKNAPDKFLSQMHEELGKKLSLVDYDLLIAAGRFGNDFIRGALKVGESPEKLIYLENGDKIIKYFKQNPVNSCTVVFKADRKVFDLEDLIDFFRDI